MGDLAGDVGKEVIDKGKEALDWLKDKLGLLQTDSEESHSSEGILDEAVKLLKDKVLPKAVDLAQDKIGDVFCQKTVADYVYGLEVPQGPSPCCAYGSDKEIEGQPAPANLVDLFNKNGQSTQHRVHKTARTGHQTLQVN